MLSEEQIREIIRRTPVGSASRRAAIDAILEGLAGQELLDAHVTCITVCAEDLPRDLLCELYEWLKEQLAKRARGRA